MKRSRSAPRPSSRRRWVLWGAAAVVAVSAVTVTVWLLTGSERGVSAPDVPEPTASGVAGYLFQDRDGDGQQGPGEPALAGWEVRVHSTGPVALMTTTTDDAGVFSFPDVENVTPGETTVAVRVQPALEGPAAADMPDPSALTQSFTLAPTETRVDTESEPGRVLLRFATSTANLGGMLHVTAGEVNTDGETQAVQQRVYGAGNVLVHDAGEFVYHAEHHHFHLGQFQSYELLSEDRSTVLGASEKISFCLTDVLPVDVPDRADGDVFLDLPPFDCGAQEQGINTGYADYYGAELPDQWIDVTDVPSGTYWIRLVVDPQGLLLESDTSNNTVYFPVDYEAP